MSKPFLSYAQNGEDIILWRALGHVDSGFFVDVGAAEPIHFSATYSLYLRGWRGINIEPVAAFAEELRTARPEDITLELAVGEFDRDVTAYVVPGTGLSTTNESRGKALVESELDVVEVSVRETTLTSVLNDHVDLGRAIHVLKVDVEGSEREVLLGLDFKVWRPWVLVIEATEPTTQRRSHDSWEPLLLEADYEYCGFDGLNRYYVAAEHRDLAADLDHGPCEFDRPFEVVHAMADNVSALITANESLDEYNRELSRLLANSQNETQEFGRQIEERVAHIKSLDALLEQERLNSADRADDFARDKANYEQLLSEANSDRTALDNCLESLRQQLQEAQSAEHELDAIRVELADVQADRMQLWFDIESVCQRLELARVRIDELDRDRAAAVEQLEALYNSETWRAGRAMWKVGQKTGASRVLRGPAERVLGRAFRTGTGSHSAAEEAVSVATTATEPKFDAAALANPPSVGPLSGAWTFPTSREWVGPLSWFADQLSGGRLPTTTELREILSRVAIDDDATLKSGLYSHRERTAVLEVSLALAARSAAEIEPGLAIIDARCFDDPGLVSRGIGRHASNVIHQIGPALDSFGHVIFLVESADHLPDSARRSNSSTMCRADLQRSHCVADFFLSLSPLTATVLPHLVGSRTKMISLVYDLIPLSFPHHYHHDAAGLVTNAASLAWLRTFDELWCISSSTATVCQHALAIDASRFRVTNVESSLPISSLQAPSDEDRTSVLVCGGGDARKNMLSPLHGLREMPGRIEIEIFGSLNPVMAADIERLLRDVPGKSLTMLGHVTDVEAAEAFRRAQIVVVPSHCEGYSLPVAEGVMAGAVVVASGIAEHRELLGDGPWLVDPYDHRMWGSAISEAKLHADEWRPQQLEAFKRSTTGRFEIGEASIKPRLKSAWMVRNRRPTLAIISPLPPQHSGIADYTSFLSPSLEKYYDLSYVVNDLAAVAPNGAPRRGSTITTLLHGQFDRVLHVLGNSHFHLPALEHLERFGGAALGHDNRMTGAYLHWLGVERTAEVMSMGGTRVLPEQVPTYLVDVDSAPNTCYGLIAEQAQPLIVHSERLAARISNETGHHVDALPFCPLRVPTSAELGKRRKRKVTEAPVIGTFGEVSLVFKRHDLLVEMLAWHRDWGFDSQLVIVGGGSEPELTWIREHASEWGVADRITITGRVDDAAFRRWLTEVDLNVQVRNSPHLTISGPAMDSVVFGVPLLTTESMAEELHGAPMVATVPNAFSSLQLALVARTLSQSHYSDVDESARTAFTASRSPERYAAMLHGLLERSSQ